ncbi:helix-turn-helix domain-containing protein [Corynebacterium sputi]|uniref:helix-turn-helix domain-containing protein n=1 Tax=Corynebacterium sputi TaxID=489915 RepID=UPI00047CB494|nr:helix-turn-helix transcriptional regulator [Corynebacterium sputi]
MDATTIGAAITRAQGAAGLSQRTLATRTGISQSTLSRITSGDRIPKVPELIKIAEATGHTVAQLTGSDAAARVHYAARSTNGSAMEEMRQRLLGFVELDAYLSDQAIPRT